ncbi:(2Fe-2S) ferredoxin domain-containing protein [Dactylosporangium sp. CA-139114]|uniref:(2Fe-2S) ferredoxin domain-containing protein n=1 Tax=Dactylosporangium sp. CA-139114 TaxID=3239931 RepID=UPI003D98FD54
MSRRGNPGTAGRGSSPGDGGCTVTVCRGCCGGTPKVPGLDHATQLARLRKGLDGTARVRTSDCLDACDYANVIVVQPSAAGRQAGGRPVWLGLVNQADAADAIDTWIRAGGPGLADPPDILELYTFNPARRVRQTLP